MVLEGVHLGEVVMHDNRGQTADERIRVVPEVGILLRQVQVFFTSGTARICPRLVTFDQSVGGCV